MDDTQLSREENSVLQAFGTQMMLHSRKGGALVLEFSREVGIDRDGVAIIF